MRFIFSQKDQRLALEAGEVDLSRAAYDESLSSSGLDADTQGFHVTLDKVLFQSPVRMIQKVLEVHGYALNLENVLACLDDLHIGVVALVGGNSSAGGAPAKKFLPCLQFRLPSPQQAGPLLKQFYAEIEGYESALKQKPLDHKPAGPAEKAKKEAHKIEELEEENRQLKEQVKQLKLELQRASQSIAQATRALSDQNVLPPSIRLATVKDLDRKERIITLKSGRTNLQLPFVKAHLVPAPGDPCLLCVKDGQVMGGYFFDSQGPSLAPTLAYVLAVKGDSCKIRDSLRRTLSLQASNDAERAIYRRLRRHTPLLLYFLDGQLIRLQELDRFPQHIFADRVQEQLAQFQIYAEAVDEQSEESA